MLLVSCTQKEQEEISNMMTNDGPLVEEAMEEENASNDTMMEKNVSDLTLNLTGINFAFSQEEIRVKKWQTVTINFESTDGYHDWVVDEFNAATDKVNPGTPTSVTFVADTAWEFEYYCSVGSHRANGMIGKLIVEDDVMMENEEEREWTEEEIKMMEEEHEWDDMMEKEDTMEEKTAMEDTMEEKVTLAWTYTDYGADLVGKTEDTVLFFHANWCPSCRAADKGILEGTIPENLSILKVDFDNSSDLKKKYGVVSQHTFVQIDADGNEIKKWLGGNGVDDVVGKLQ